MVNTCTVTGEGDYKSRKIIRALSRDNPGTRTIVMGCYATRDPQAVGELPGVFEVVTDKRELPDVLSRQGVHDIPDGDQLLRGAQAGLCEGAGWLHSAVLVLHYSLGPSGAAEPDTRIDRSGSPPTDRQRTQRDHPDRDPCRAHYGVDTTRGKTGLPPFRLWHLFRQLDRIHGNWRMRLSSIEANEVDEDFFRAAADCEHLCPQFHPALQSGSDTVLTECDVDTASGSSSTSSTASASSCPTLPSRLM